MQMMPTQGAQGPESNGKGPREPSGRVECPKEVREGFFGPCFSRTHLRRCRHFSKWEHIG